MILHDFMVLIGVKTAILTVAATLVWGALSLFRCRIPQWHRLAWGTVLVLGIFAAGFPLSINVENAECRVQNAEFLADELARDETSNPSLTLRAASDETAIPGDVIENAECRVQNAEFRDAEIRAATVMERSHENETSNRSLTLRAASDETADNAADERLADFVFSASPRETKSMTDCIAPLLFAVWIAGIITVLLFRMIQHARLLRHLKTATPASGEFAEQWAQLLAERNISPASVSLLVTEKLGPALALIRLKRGMAVLVPQVLWEEASPAVREGILRHELTHFQNGDWYVSMFARLLVLVHWFNPFAWLAVRKLDEATEWICDAAAFGDDEEGELRFAESMIAVHQATPMFLLNRHSFGSGKLTRRVHFLQNFLSKKKEPIMKRLFLGATLALLLTAGLFRPQFIPVEAGAMETAEEQPTATTVDNQTTQTSSDDDAETFRLEVNCRLPEGISEEITVAVLLSNVDHRRTTEKNEYDTITLEGEKQIQLYENLKADADGKAVRDHLKLPIDARWFDQQTGKQYVNLPKNAQGQEYFIRATSKNCSSLWQKVGVPPRLFPRPKGAPSAEPPVISENIELFPSKTISGVVVDENGEPLGSVVLRVDYRNSRNIWQSRFISPYNPVTTHYPDFAVTSDHQGRFEIKDVPVFDDRFGNNPWDIVSQQLHIYPAGEITDLYEDIDAGFTSDQKMPMLIVLKKKNGEKPKAKQPRGERGESQQSYPPVASMNVKVTQEETVTVKVIDSATKLPIKGIDLAVSIYGPEDDAVKASPRQIISDQNGEATVTILRTTILGGPQVDVYSKSYLISVIPTKKDGKVYVSNGYSQFINIPHYKHAADNAPIDELKLYVTEGHLLVGRVINARDNQPLAKTDDGKPIQVGLASPFGWDEKGYLLDTTVEKTNVDENGMFQFYVQDGVQWPYILDNGADRIWQRTVNNQQWQKEGVLIKPGKITTIEFRVQPRLDTGASVAELPVLEEQSAVAKLVMLGIGGYTLDKDRHIRELVVSSTTPLKVQLPLIRELKQLKILNISHLSPPEITDEDIQQILELPALTTLIADEHPEHAKKGGTQRIEGKENIQKYFKDEFPKIREWHEKQPRGGMGMGAMSGGGGMGGMVGGNSMGVMGGGASGGMQPMGMGN